MQSLKNIGASQVKGLSISQRFRNRPGGKVEGRYPRKVSMAGPNDDSVGGGSLLPIFKIAKTKKGEGVHSQHAKSKTLTPNNVIKRERNKEKDVIT